MNITEYIESVIGKPWVDRAAGPNAFDCWGLVVDSFDKVEGVELPTVLGYSDGIKTSKCAKHEIERSHWIEVDNPTAGLVFVCEHSGGASHVGRMIDSTWCLHSPHGGSGVQVNKLAAMKRLNRNQTYRYFKYAPNSIS